MKETTATGTLWEDRILGRDAFAACEAQREAAVASRESCASDSTRGHPKILLCLSAKRWLSGCLFIRLLLAWAVVQMFFSIFRKCQWLECWMKKTGSY